jgi:hypothetical protein
VSRFSDLGGRSAAEVASLHNFTYEERTDFEDA